MRPVLLLALSAFFISASSSWAGPAEIASCLKQVTPLKAQREQVAELDGIWGLFQKKPALHNNSVEGITLDNKANSILFHLEYLCNTIDGIPFDELADYVSTNLAEKGEQKFRKELINLGKNNAQIEVWFEFVEFAIANRYRALVPKKISRAIQAADHFIKRYLELAKKINHEKDMDSVVQEAQDLVVQIETFFESDPYMSQALHENFQIPFADWDENYGGS